MNAHGGTASSVWTIERHHARLTLPGCAANLDLLNPAGGLDGLLGVELGRIEPRDAETQIDVYARQGDLVATFAETPARPLRAQVYWRARTDGDAALVELVASVQTSLLDSDPRLTIGSRQECDEILRLIDPDKRSFAPVDATRELAMRTAPACFLFRRAGSTSYAEMVYPVDVHATSLACSQELPEAVLTARTRHELFADRLEKGVILRARVLGMFVPRQSDAAKVAEIYSNWSRSEPPLTV